jgi:hypothetical protein
MFLQKSFSTFLIVLALLAVPALAQQHEHQRGMQPGAGMGGSAMPEGEAGGMPMMGMMRMMMGEEGMGGMRMMAAMTRHVEGRLAFLKTELKITDAQLPLWNKFADAVRDDAKTMGGMMQGGMMGAAQRASLPDRLAMREKMMTERLEVLRRFKAAVDPLYAALSDEQKKTADELLIGPMGMM